MKKLLLLSVSILLISCTQTDQVKEPKAFVCPDGFEIPSGIVGTIENPFQGDILIDPTKQAGVITRLWEGKVIPVYFDERFEGTSQKDSVYKAFKEFESIGFTFIEYSELPMLDPNVPNDMDVVHIKWSGIARTYIGKLGGEQELYLPVFWNTFYNAAIHELGHLVGLWHPHNTPMQDEWLIINWDNIQEDKLGFFKAFENENFEYGDEYPVTTVMNYSSYVFAINTSIPTMTLKDGTEFESSDNLTDTDRLSINRMYECFENRKF